MESVPPVPSVSEPSAAESAVVDDKELQDEMEQWKQRMMTLKNNEKFEDKVSYQTLNPHPPRTLHGIDST